MTIHSDNRLVDAPLLPVRCGRCGAQVLARKSSWQQTSIQWTAEAAAMCSQRREAEALKQTRHGRFLLCSDLRDSIGEAVERGELPIVDEFTG